LLQLAQVGLIQLAIQFRLAGEDDLQELAQTRILQVAEQADLLQNVPIEIVRLVDDQNRRTPFLGLLDEQLIQGEEDFGLGLSRAAKVQIVGDHFEELLDVDAGIEKEGEFHVLESR